MRKDMFGRKGNFAKKLILQRAAGFLMLVLSAVIIWFASNGTTPEDMDCTVVLFTIPAGLCMLLSREVFIL